MNGERTITWRDRCIGVLGPGKSSATLVWLASHRGRLHTLLLGGKRLSLLVVYDSQGNEQIPERSEAEIQAMAAVVYGPPQDVKGVKLTAQEVAGVIWACDHARDGCPCPPDATFTASELASVARRLAEATR